jgi:glutamine amidotransferase
MCRLLAYLGPPVGLDALLLAPKRSFMRQAWAPEHQRANVVNVDGFGVGWYDPAVRTEPARYRRAVPIWADRNFADVASFARSGAVLASLRAASTGLPVEESGTAPYTWGPWLFAHNGEVDEFRSGAAAALRRKVSDARLTLVEGTTDSEFLFALALDRLDAGDGPGAALVDVVRTVLGVSGGRLNLMLTDGTRVAATVLGNSLFVRERPGAVWVASEPTDDDGGWEPVPEGALVEGTAEGLTVTEAAL